MNTMVNAGIALFTSLMVVCIGLTVSTAFAADTFALISTQNGKFVRAGVGQNSLLAAVSDHSKSWETFEKIPLGGTRVAIRSVQSRKYVRAGVGSQTLLAAVSDRVAGWETFEWIELGGGRIALRSVQNGNYVRAGVGPDTLLAAVSDHVKSWETFTYVVVASTVDIIQPTPVPAAPPQSPAPQPPTTPGLTTEMQAILDAHNQHRSKHCVAHLTWSPAVAAQAGSWANQCSFQHSNSSYGENIWMGSAGHYSPAQIVGSWYSEAANYDFSKPGYSPSTGHFSQVIWKDTTQLGCAKAVCQGNDLWVCNYSPAGNFMGQFPQNVLPANCP